MKEILNKTTIYSTIFIILNSLFAFIILKLIYEFQTYWIKMNYIQNQPLPPATSNIVYSNGMYFFILNFIFIFSALLAIKKGKARKIAFHAMMLGIICEMFVWAYTLIGFMLPLVVIKNLNSWQ